MESSPGEDKNSRILSQKLGDVNAADLPEGKQSLNFVIHSILMLLHYLS